MKGVIGRWHPLFAAWAVAFLVWSDAPGWFKWAFVPVWILEVAIVVLVEEPAALKKPVDG